MTDPLFERRQLVRVLTVPPKYIQRNIRGSLLGQLGTQVEGKCGTEGYIQPKSSVILDHSLGKLGLLNSGVQYRVTFHADVCYPHKGQIFQAPVSFKSKIGIHAELSPIRVLLPRDLHIGNPEFESLEERDEIKFEVLGAEFKQNDDAIFVLAKFVEKIGGAPAVTEEAVVEEETSAPIPTTSAPTEEVKRVSIKETATVPETPTAPRRRKRLSPKQTLQLNVEAKEGEA